jgi:hypothetical protein
MGAKNKQWNRTEQVRGEVGPMRGSTAAATATAATSTPTIGRLPPTATPMSGQRWPRPREGDYPQQQRPRQGEDGHAHVRATTPNGHAHVRAKTIGRLPPMATPMSGRRWPRPREGKNRQTDTLTSASVISPSKTFFSNLQCLGTVG